MGINYLLHRHFATDCEKLFLSSTVSIIINHLVKLQLVGLILLRVVFGSPKLAMLKPKGPKQNAEEKEVVRGLFVVGTCVVF